MIEIKGLIFASAFISCIIITKGITDYILGKCLAERKGGVHESAWINQLKALESRVAFLELKEYDPEDFVEFDKGRLITHGWNVVAKSENDYGEKIRVDKNTLQRQKIKQTNQKYYEYAIYIQPNVKYIYR